MSAVKIKREQELARISLPRDEVLIVRAVEYTQGGLRCDLRRFYKDPQGELRPTSKGIGIRREWLLELRRALDAFEGMR